MLAGNSPNLAAPLGASPAQIEKEEKRLASAEAPEQRDLFAKCSLCQFGTGLYCALARRQIPLIGIPETEGRIERP